ncbi:MAG TPA: hypothetical protein VGK86_01905 [Thermoanaerobaculia bacterium]
MADREAASPDSLRSRLAQRLARLRAELERLRFETDRGWDELLSRLAENPEEILPEEMLRGPVAAEKPPTRGALSIESARRLDEATDQVQALTRFLEECLRHASRAVLLVERDGCVQPWKSAGFGGPQKEKRSSVFLPAADALERVRDGAPQVLREGNEISRALGAADAAEAVLVPFVVREKVSGALYADAISAERTKLDPEAIALLTYLAGLVVDRLAKRKLFPSPALLPLENPAAPSVREEPGPEVVRSLGGPLAPTTTEESRDEARRFARLLASEIKLYNEDAIVEGRERRNLSARLRDDIERGRRLYEQRVAPEVRAGADYYYEELVDVLADGRPENLGMSLRPPAARE